MAQLGSGGCDMLASPISEGDWIVDFGPPTCQLDTCLCPTNAEMRLPRKLHLVFIADTNRNFAASVVAPDPRYCARCG